MDSKHRTLHIFSHKLKGEVHHLSKLVCVALSMMFTPFGIAQGAEPSEGEEVERDADRIIRELRDTTLLPVLDELRMNWVRLGDANGDLAHWFFGLDTVFWVDGRHDAVSWNTGSRSRSMEQTVGVNQRAYAAMRQGKLHTLGGTGIYREHSNLFVFNVLMGWDLVKVIGDEPPAITARRVVERNGNAWMVLGSLAQALGSDEGMESVVWELDFLTMEWRRVGNIHPKLLRRLGDFRAFSVGGYAVIYGVGTGGIFHPESGKFVELPGYSFSEMPKFQAYGGRDAEIFWFSRGANGEWRHQRMDLEAEFSKGKATDFFGDEEETASSGLVWWLVGVLLMGGVGTWYVRSREVVEPVVPVEEVVAKPAAAPAVSEAEDEADWELVMHLLAQDKRLMNAQEMNLLLGIGEGVSDDSSRSRRARAIRRMNAAFERRYQAPFITRERDVQDRRHLLYKVNEIPAGNA